VNTAAAIAFTLVMLTGLGGISWNAWNNQRATPEPVADDPLDQPQRRTPHHRQRRVPATSHRRTPMAPQRLRGSGMTVLLCDRCGNQYTTHPTWPNRPLCTPCLIPTRHTENNNTWTRPLNRHELEHAWRTALFTQWQTELS
jgi:hypothetical protein